MELMNLLQLAVFLTVWRRDHLQSCPISAAAAQNVLLDFGTSIAVFGTSIAIAFASPLIALYSWLFLVPLKLVVRIRERKTHRTPIA